MMFNLDDADPIAHRIAAWSGDNPRPAEPYFDSHNILLAKGEPEVLFIRAEVERFYATFDLEIDYTVGKAIGVERRMIVTNHGQPFRVTGPNSGPRRWSVVYQHIFEVNDSDPYALCEVINPHFFSLNTLGAPPCYGSKNG
jgi:hypothetical protein